MLEGPPFVTLIIPNTCVTHATPVSYAAPVTHVQTSTAGLQLIWSTALELANSNWQAQRGKGTKACQDSVDAALTGSPLRH